MLSTIDGSTALHLACCPRTENRCPSQMEIAKMLLEKGADVRALDNEGDTPLHHAACAGEEDRSKLVELLLENGSDLEAGNNDGEHTLAPRLLLCTIEDCQNVA